MPDFWFIFLQSQLAYLIMNDKSWVIYLWTHSTWNIHHHSPPNIHHALLPPTTYHPPLPTNHHHLPPTPLDGAGAGAEAGVGTPRTTHYPPPLDGAKLSSMSLGPLDLFFTVYLYTILQLNTELVNLRQSTISYFCHQTCSVHKQCMCLFAANQIDALGLAVLTS